MGDLSLPAIDEAVRYLRASPFPADEQACQAALDRIADYLRGLGVGSEKAYELTAEHWIERHTNDVLPYYEYFNKCIDAVYPPERPDRTPPAANESTLHAALSLANDGFRVFPVQPNEKKPAIGFKWQDAATADAERIRAWFSGPYRGHNIGVALNARQVVLDSDAKGGKRGLNSLDLLDLKGLPHGWRVRTPSGGMHVYLTLPGGIVVGNRVGSIPGYPDVDTRTLGGYVLGPGSTIGGRGYEDLGGEPEPAPDWLIALLSTAGRRKERVDNRQTLVKLDTAHAVDRFRNYLIHDAPEAIEGAGGDQTTYGVACTGRDYGLSEDAIFDLMAEHWNERKASPPWPLDDLRVKVSNAWRYAQNPAGAKTAEAEFEAVPGIADTARHPAKAVRSGLYKIDMATCADQALTLSTDPLIEGLIEQKTFVMLYGPHGSGKSFVMLDIAYHIAVGQPWQGREVAKGAVLYVAAEGGHGIRKRVAAIKKHYRADGSLFVVPCSVDLFTHDADIDAVIRLGQEAAKEAGEPLQLIVVDTLARAIAGGDEHSPTDMGKFIRNVDRMREKVGCTIAVVHHTGHSEKNRSRGHSSLPAAVDTEIAITEKREIKITKQRDLEPLDKPLMFRLRQVNLGEDAKGRPMGSCVVEVITGTEFMQIDLSPAAEVMWEAYQIAAKDKAERPDLWREQTVTRDEWEESYLQERKERPARNKKGVPEEVSARYMRDLRNTVEQSGRVKKITSDQWVAA